MKSNNDSNSHHLISFDIILYDIIVIDLWYHRYYDFTDFWTRHQGTNLLTIVVAQALCLSIFNLSPTQKTCLFTDGNKANVSVLIPSKTVDQTFPPWWDVAGLCLYCVSLACLVAPVWLAEWMKIYLEFFSFWMFHKLIFVISHPHSGEDSHYQLEYCCGFDGDEMVMKWWISSPSTFSGCWHQILP